MRPLSFALAAAAMAWSATPSEADTIELGTRESGKTYNLQLDARNENCPQPLDFMFTTGTPWIKLPPDPVVHQVPPAQSRPLNAVLNFANVQPGNHTGMIEVECVNCGWFIFKSCKIDKQTLQLRARVTPGPGMNEQPQPNVPGQPPGIGGGNTPVPLPPARPGEGEKILLPYRPQIPDDVRIRIENAQRALEDAKRAELPCKSWLVPATLARTATTARDKAAKAKQRAADMEAAAREAEAASQKAKEEANAAAAEADKSDEAAKEQEGFARWVKGGKHKPALDYAAALRKKADDAAAVAKAKASAQEQAKLKAAKVRQEADRAAREARKAEEDAKAAEAARKAKEDECARLKKAREDAERELAEAEAAAQGVRGE